MGKSVNWLLLVITIPLCQTSCPLKTIYYGKIMSKVCKGDTIEKLKMVSKGIILLAEYHLYNQPGRPYQINITLITKRFPLEDCHVLHNIWVEILIKYGLSQNWNWILKIAFLSPYVLMWCYLSVPQTETHVKIPFKYNGNKSLTCILITYR